MGAEAYLSIITSRALCFAVVLSDGMPEIYKHPVPGSVHRCPNCTVSVLSQVLLQAK